MQIGEVIRKYRKQKNMTQEEMANRLGVTAPAVNKWENGVSLPDITLLAPIARLLDITLDTLLSFREELTEVEINSIVQEVDSKFRLKNESFEEVFEWVKKKIELYPNSYQLIWQMAVILDAWRMIKEIPDTEKYDGYIEQWYVHALESTDEKIRTGAADSLFGFYTRKEQYEKAEKYLSYFSEQNPERKRKQAFLYSKTNRINEAYKTYEELLFSGYQMLSVVLNGIYTLAMQDNNMQKAHAIVDKQEALAKLFEMGEYHEVFSRLELAMVEKDADTAVEIMRRILASVEKIGDFSKASLYEHMEFKENSREFAEELKKKLLENFRDEEKFGFLKEDERWHNITMLKS